MVSESESSFTEESPTTKGTGSAAVFANKERNGVRVFRLVSGVHMKEDRVVE